eukprot:scaffold75636_cov39-Phaeocystis_antarctica.AAC.1
MPRSRPVQPTRRSRGAPARLGLPSGLPSGRERSSPRGVHARGMLRRRSRAPSYFSTLTGSVGHRNTHIYTYSGPAPSPSSSTASVRAGTSRSSTTATTALTSAACSLGCRCHRRSCPSSTP